jgi:signal transduction histidine kinase
MTKVTTIKSRLMIAFVTIALFVVIVGIVGILNSLQIKAAFDVAANRSLPELLVLRNIQSSVNKISSDVVGFALISPVTKLLHQEKMQQIIQDGKTLTVLVSQLNNIVVDDKKENTETFIVLKYLTSAYSSISLQLISSKDKRLDDQSILNLISTADDIRSEIETTINKRINTENAELHNEITKANGFILIQQEEIIIVSVIACVASLIIGRHISLNSIIKPLLRLKQATIQMTRGDFGFDEMESNVRADEIGELSMQFDNMRQILNQRTKQLESSNKQLSLAYEQLKEHDKMQRDFINIAAHELRTPIEPLLLGSEELKQILPNDEIVSIVFRNAKRLQALANNILDASRIESSIFKLYKEHVNIKDIISNALLAVDGPNGDKVKIMYKPKDFFLEADKDRITQVISNLLRNAIVFTKEGTIFVNVEEEKNNQDQALIISIKDTGSGIDPEIYPRLFTKFATKSETGTGLGLFICKSIIEAHGGKIWAQNNVDGKGAVFAIRLPITSNKGPGGYTSAAVIEANLLPNQK